MNLKKKKTTFNLVHPFVPDTGKTRGHEQGRTPSTLSRSSDGLDDKLDKYIDRLS